jgi:nitrate/TMAO reductase-like tetraheme cytochrome c subunit
MRALVLLAVLALAPAAAARAEGSPERVPPVTNAATKKECGDCHMAFQPRLLPAESWRRVMSGLKDHFGEDASLDAKLAAEIEAYLVSHAGRGDGALTRISDQSWFVRKHRRITPAEWTRPAVKSKANCAACHADAERGVYED